MPENEQEFVVSDRRKFRMDGDTLEHVATAEPDKAPEPEATQTAAPGAGDLPDGRQRDGGVILILVTPAYLW